MLFFSHYWWGGGESIYFYTALPRSKMPPWALNLSLHYLETHRHTVVNVKADYEVSFPRQFIIMIILQFYFLLLPALPKDLAWPWNFSYKLCKKVSFCSFFHHIQCIFVSTLYELISLMDLWWLERQKRFKKIKLRNRLKTFIIILFIADLFNQI